MPIEEIAQKVSDRYAKAREYRRTNVRTRGL